MGLISELERVEAGSRELDGKIQATVDGNDIADWRQYDWSATLPDYTTSLDAALALVPEGFEWELSWLDSVATCKMGDPTLRNEPEAATPALALCIAALKARA